jgi:hypothetical protein
MRRLTLFFLTRAELTDTSVRVCQENERLKAALARTTDELVTMRAAYQREARSVRQLRNDLADLQEFLAIIPFGGVS